MRMNATVLGFMLLLSACGDKKAPGAPPPVSAPSGVEKGSAPPPVVSVEKPVEVKPEPAPEKPEVAKAEPSPEKAEPEVAKAEPVPEKAEPEVAKPEPTPEPEVAKPEPEPAGATAIAPDMEVTDSALTSEVVDRVPSDRKTSWKIGEDARLIGWFELKNPGTKVDLELVWKKDGKENWRFPTSVGTGKNWRTWAEKRIGKRDAGQWTVELVDANGYVYGSLSYTVE